MVDVPSRNVLSIIADGDPRAVKFFEQIASEINANGVGPVRPAAPFQGQQHFDTSLSRPIWWTGTMWINAAGVAV
ncbi:MAG: hypothetical protein V4657_02905 [Pseudomonadota bacterium]